MITIKEMAEMLGISTTTVSNVINGKTSEVSQKTAEKVQKLLDEYDYVPNMNAKNLAQNHSRLIGIVLKRRKDKYENIFTDPFHGELLGALESAIREQGYYMMIYISEDIEEIVRNIVGWNTEGLILIGMLQSVTRRSAMPSATGTVSVCTLLCGARKASSCAPRKYPLAASSGFLISGTHRTMSPPCHWG